MKLAGLAAGFKGSPLRWRLEKYFWVAATVVFVVMDLWFRTLWDKVAIVIVAAISGYALVLNCASCETAAEARNMADPRIPDPED